MALRVAHIIAGLEVGGAERHLVNLLNAMSCDYRAVICLGSEPTGSSFHTELDPAIEQLFVRVRRRSLPLGIIRLASILRKAHVNVVHTHMYSSNLYGAVASKLAGVPVVVTSEHGENPWKRFHQRWLERHLISPLVDVRFCVSPRILEIRRYRDGVPAAKLRLMVNGTVLPVLKNSGTSNPIPVIGAVGRFIPAKDYSSLLHAIADLRRRGYEFQVHIVGDGPELDAIRGVAADLQLNSIVSFPGKASDMDAWYRRFDIYVSSSIREGLPLALLEAMAHSLPVVATDVGASSSTVGHGEGGLIIPCSEPKLLADALAKLLDDAGLRDRLGHGARKRIEQHFSINRVAELHEDTYRGLLASKMASTGKRL